MRRRVIHPMPLEAAWLGAIAMSWLLLVVPMAEAATARAELKDVRGVRVGEASLQDTPEGVKVSATFSELPAGDHAFHVHAIGRCEPPFESAGGHFNPTNRQHGRDNPQGAHAGDMPNLQVPERKTAQIEIVLKDVTLETGPNRLLDADGASLVVHERADDYVTDPAGNAGARIACGVITTR
jgi:superoxide dismutase, Cu-Zn family